MGLLCRNLSRSFDGLNQYEDSCYYYYYYYYSICGGFLLKYGNSKLIHYGEMLCFYFVMKISMFQAGLGHLLVTSGAE